MNKLIRPLSLLGGIAVAVACSSENDGRVGSQTSALTNSTELANAQAYIDTKFYTDAEIQYSFHTAAGEKIDCIDFYAQRSVKGMLSAGVSIDATKIPNAPTPPSTIPPAYKPPGISIGFDGSLDRDGLARRCPTGTVPKTRPLLAQIEAVGGLDAFKAKGKSEPHPLDSNQDANQPDCYHQTTGGPGWDHAAGYQYTTAYGALTYTAVYQPTVNSGEHSLSQMWVHANSCEDWYNPYGDANTCSTAADAGTSTAAVQSLEVGWMVGNDGSPACDGLSGSALTACLAEPYIFAFITQDGYASENCFAGGAGSDGVIGDCCPSASGSEGTDCWVVAPSAEFVVGQLLGSYVQPLDNPPAEMAIQVWNGSQLGSGYQNWYVYIDGYLIGWYPTSGSAGTAAFSGTMASYGTYMQMGGEVYDAWAGSAHTTAEMGSGITPACGAYYAAYQRNVNYINSSAAYVSATLSNVTTPSGEGDNSIAGLCGFDAGTTTWGGGEGYNIYPNSGNTRSGTGWGEYFFFGGSNDTYCP
jgi:hypothetical protein